MSKLAPSSTKYVVKATIKANGVVEKPDVIGAIFGQTEGLLGPDLNLRELQRTGRIGRIEVNIKSEKGKSEGQIIIPSSLSSAETSLIAATLETIERIGPCTANIKLDAVDDAMSAKRRYVVDKAKDILKGLSAAGIPNVEEVSEQIREAVRTDEIRSYQGMPCGPNLKDSDNMVILEGRADVLNLLKFGIRNTIAIEGTSVPQAIVNLCKEKVVTVFTDGDRGGRLIAKELLQLAEIDFIVHAPDGKEVEELSKKEVFKALREKVSAEQYKMDLKENGDRGKYLEKKTEKKEFKTEKKFERKPATRSYTDRKPSFTRERTYRKTYLKPAQKQLFKKTLDELVGTRAACLFDSKNNLLGRVPVKELENTIRSIQNPETIVFDGKVDFKIESIAKRSRVKFLIGMEKEDLRSPVNIFDKKDLA